MRETEWERLRKMSKGRLSTDTLETFRPRRLNKRDIPEGGISMSEASRRYDIPLSTLSYWLKVGFITQIKKTGKFKYVDEKQIQNLSTLERRVGVRTVKK